MTHNYRSYALVIGSQHSSKKYLLTLCFPSFSLRVRTFIKNDSIFNKTENGTNGSSHSLPENETGQENKNVSSLGILCKI